MEGLEENPRELKKLRTKGRKGRAFLGLNPADSSLSCCVGRRWRGRWCQRDDDCTRWALPRVDRSARIVWLTWSTWPTWMRCANSLSPLPPLQLTISYNTTFLLNNFQSEESRRTKIYWLLLSGQSLVHT